MASPLIMLLVALTAANVFSELFTKIGLPRAAGQITAGLVIGATALKSIFTAENTQLLSFMANLGIVLMFYYIGVKTDLKVFAKGAKKAVTVSLLNTLVPFTLTFVLLKQVFNLDPFASIIVGVAASVSAQAVSIDVLEELKIMRTKLGRSIIVTGAIDDVIELLIVGVLLSFLQLATSDFALGRFVLEIAAFLAVITAARLWAVPAAVKMIEKRSSTVRFSSSILLVILISTLAETLQIGAPIGAIAAGIIIRQTTRKASKMPNWEITHSIHAISFGFLIPLFFFWTGLSTNIATVTTNLPLVLLLLFVSTVGTVGSTAIAVMANRGSWKEGLLMGWGLNPKGDIDIVIASLALHAQRISYQLFTAIVIMSLATAILSPIVFKILAKKYKAAV